MHKESIYDQFAYSPERVDHLFVWLINNPDGIVLVDGDPVCGLVAGLVQDMWHSEGKEAFNLPLYVLPENRGGRYAVRLVNEYKRRSVELGANPEAINWVNNSGIDVEKTNDFIGRMGFAPIGGYFRMLH
jgi:GNAT superfamily N-acetyltransferase